MPLKLAVPKNQDELAPWVPGAVAKRIIGLQTILGFCLLCTTFLLAIITWKLATVPPRLITQQRPHLTLKNRALRFLGLGNFRCYIRTFKHIVP